MATGCVAPARAADEVVFASGADLESGNPLVTVHPLSRQVHRHVLFVTLARYDSALVPRPYAARAWSWSPDRRTLTIVMHPLRWHDGRRVTAADAAFTLDAARDPATGYARAGDLASITRIATSGDTALQLDFATAQAGFPPVLNELPILPRHLLGSVSRADMRRAPFNLAPVGNGPFRFVERRPGERWVFERNESFPRELGGPPYIRRLTVAVVDEATTKFAALASGEVDVAGISPTMASLVRRDDSMRVLDYPVLFSTALVFNTHRAPFDDVRVRRAVSLSLDRQRIVTAALAGFGTPAAGPVPPESPLALPSAVEEDGARADSLLDAAGWKRAGDDLRRRAGRTLEVELMTVGSGDNAVEQLLQADLRARGIGVRIRQAEMGAFLTEARAARPRFDMLFTGIPGDVSLSYLAAMYDGRQAGGALDYGRFHTPALDARFTRVRAATTDEEMRRALLAVQELLRDEQPAAWVYHARGVQGVSARLAGVVMDLRGEMATVTSWHVPGTARAAGSP